MNYMYTLGLGSTNFPKTLRPIQKHRGQKRDIWEVHNLKQSLPYCCSTHNSKTPRVCLSPHPDLQVTLITGKIWNADSTCVLEAVYIEIQDCYYGNKHDILSASKSVAWYWKYMYIKACLPKGYVHRARRQFEMMFIPAHEEVNHTQAMAHCPIILLSFT